MLPLVVTLAALILLVMEMAQPAGQPLRPVIRVLRWLPFVIVAGLSIWVAGSAPYGRKPFFFDLTVSLDDLAQAMTKVAHLRSIAIIFLLAVLAVGSQRLLWAFAMVMAVGVGWELAETTVVRHHARLVDLAPDLVSALVTLAFTAVLRRAITSFVQRGRVEEPPSPGA